MRYWKFLARGGVGPISGVAWPRPPEGGGAPGAWLEAGGPVDPCRTGLHLCREAQLAFWLHDELWEVEVEGALTDGYDCVIAERGRLVREVEAWRGELGAGFARAAADHAAAVVGDAPAADRARVANYVEAARGLAAAGLAVGAGYVAAVAVARLREESGAIEAAYRAERSYQSAWLHANLAGR